MIVSLLAETDNQVERRDRVSLLAETDNHVEGHDGVVVS